jgi:hypothetical protein
LFEFVTDLFSGGDKKAATPAPAPAPAAEPAPAPAPAAAHVPAAQANATAPAPAAATTPANGAAPDPTAHKPVDQKACADAANTIFKKMDGWWVSGSDKSAILDTLRGKSPDEVAAIKASYAEHFPGHDMDKDVGKNLDGKDLTEAKASMSGDPVAASVAAIKNAETGTFFGNVDSDKVTKVLEGISDPKVRAEVAKQVGGEVSSMQSGNDKELTQALLAGDTAKANAVKIDSSMHSTGFAISQFVNNNVAGGLLGKDFGLDKDGINSTLESVKDPAQRQKMLDDYKAKTGQDLRTELASKQDGASKDVSNKLLDGDVAAANAARVKAATESFFTDKDAIYKAMDGKSPDERKQMLTDYNKMYGDKGGDLDKTLKDNLSGLDLQKAQELKDQGKLDDAFAMKYAMEGSFWSTDKTLLKKTLDGKSKEEIAKLSGDYKSKYGIDLQGELGQTTSGRDGFEINELMKGEPKTIDEKMDRSRARYDFERGSGSNPVSKAFVDTFSDKGQMLDAQNARMEDLYKKIQSGGASSDEKALLDRVTGYQGQDVKTYQENKDSVANGAAAVAAIAASTAATVVTGGAAAPAEVAIIAALCGGGATIATKAIIQDSGYSNEELRNDMIMTGVNAATGGAMGALGSEGGALFNMAGKVTDNAVAQQMIIQGMSGAVTSGVGGATQTMLAGGDAKAMLQAGGMGMVSGGVGGAVTGGVGAGLKGNQMFEGMDPVKAAMLRNAIAGGTGGVAGLAVTPDAYKGDSAALIQKWGLAVGGGAAGGAAGGYNEGTTEVQTAKALQTEEQQAAQVKDGKLPTADEKATLAQARVQAENPNEAKSIDKVEADLAAGKTPKLPVEESDNPVPVKTAATTDGDVKPTVEQKVVTPTEDTPVAAKVTPADEKVAAVADKAVVAPADEPGVKITEPAAPAGKTLTPDQQAVMELAGQAKTASDWDAVRALQQEHGLPVAPHDQAERNALMDLSRTSTPEEASVIRELGQELDTKNPAVAHGAMSDLIAGAKDPSGVIDPAQRDGLIDLVGGLHTDAKATDLDGVAGKNAGPGVIDNVEGASLKNLRHQLGTDDMNMLDSMAARGLDRGDVQALMEKLRLVDSGHSAGPTASHLDEHGNPLLPPSALTPEEKALWLETTAGRFEDLNVGETQMAKVVPKSDASAYATGKRGSPGNVSPQNSVGGFISMAAHSDGLTAPETTQMGGLDSDWHHGVNMFDKNTNLIHPDVAGPNGVLDVLQFPLSQPIYDGAQVPLGADAKGMMQQEAARLQAAQSAPSALGRTEEIPTLLQPTTTAGAVDVDANGLPVLPHVFEMNRDIPSLAPTPAGGDSNPFTGWGSSSTRRAVDPVTGADLPVIPNQELRLAGARKPLPAGSELTQVTSSGAVNPVADIGGGVPPTITTTDVALQQQFWDHLMNLGVAPPGPRP